MGFDTSYILNKKIPIENKIERTVIATDLKTSLTTNIPVEYGKDLNLTIINKGVDNAVSVIITGTKIDKTAYHWLGSYVDSNTAFSLTNNTITLKAGETVLALSEYELSSYESVQVQLFGAETSALNAY